MVYVLVKWVPCHLSQRLTQRWTAVPSALWQWMEMPTNRRRVFSQPPQGLHTKQDKNYSSGTVFLHRLFHSVSLRGNQLLSFIFCLVWTVIGPTWHFLLRWPPRGAGIFLSAEPIIRPRNKEPAEAPDDSRMRGAGMWFCNGFFTPRTEVKTQINIHLFLFMCVYVSMYVWCLLGGTWTAAFTSKSNSGVIWKCEDCEKW